MLGISWLIWAPRSDLMLMFAAGGRLALALAKQSAGEYWGGYQRGLRWWCWTWCAWFWASWWAGGCTVM